MDASSSPAKLVGGRKRRLEAQRKIRQEQEQAKKTANNLEPAQEAEDDTSRPKRRHVTPSNLTATVTGDELDRIIG